MSYKIEPATREETTDVWFTLNLPAAIDVAKDLANTSGVSFVVYDRGGEITAVLDPEPVQ